MTGGEILVTNDFEELGDADIVRLMALQPPAIDTTMFDEGSESTMGLDYPFPARLC